MTAYDARRASSSGPEPGPEGFAEQVPRLPIGSVTDEMVDRAAAALADLVMPLVDFAAKDRLIARTVLEAAISPSSRGEAS